MLVKTVCGHPLVMNRVAPQTYVVTEWRTGYRVKLAYVRAVKQQAAVKLVGRTAWRALQLRGLTGRGL